MRVEFDSVEQSITVNGIPISLEVLEAISNPDPSKVFSFERRGNMVWATTYLRTPSSHGQVPA